MSTETEVDFGIGWIIDDDLLPASMKKTIPEKSHQEKRFDPKSGKELPSETVIDVEESEVFVLKGKEYSDDDDFYEALAKAVGGNLVEFGCYNAGEVSHMIEIPLPKATQRQIGGRTFVTPRQVSVVWVLKQLPKLQKIQRSLRDLGISVGEPAIVLQTTVN